MALDFPGSPSLNDVFSTSGMSWRWNGVFWASVAYGSGGARTTVYPTAGATTISVAYTPTAVDIYRNGSKQVVGDDVTASNGTSIVFAKAFGKSEVVEIVANGIISVLDALKKDQNLADLTNAATARANLLVPIELVEQKTPLLNASSIDFTNFPAGFNRFVLEIDGVGVTSDDSLVGIRFQTGGSTWQATGYSYVGRMYGTGSGVDISSTIDSYTTGVPLYRIGTGNGVSNAAGAGLSAQITFNAKDTSNRRRFRFASDYTRQDGADVGVSGVGTYVSTTAITGVRVYPGSAFKAQGNVKLFGIRS